MHWMIKCKSKPDTDDLRNATIEEHVKFLDGYRENTWFSGPLFTDDGTSAIGSLRFIEFPDRAAASAYIEADPYTTAGIFERIDIFHWQPESAHRQLTYARRDGTTQFIIHATDGADSDDRRAQRYDLHCAFMERHDASVIARGALKDDAGVSFIGSALLLDVADRAAAEALWADEPFNRAGVYDAVTIERWIFGHV